MNLLDKIADEVTKETQILRHIAENTVCRADNTYACYYNGQLIIAAVPEDLQTALRMLWKSESGCSIGWVE